MRQLNTTVLGLAAAVVALAVHAPPTQSAPQVEERVQSGVTASSDGAALFRTWCASCHGTKADGTGPLAGQLRRRVPDLTQIAEKNGGMFPLERVRRIIDGREIGAHGNPDMPVWGTTFRVVEGASEASVRARIDALVRYLESVQRRNAQ